MCTKNSNFAVEKRFVFFTIMNARQILEENILPYWLKMQDPMGGFYGAATTTDQPNALAERSCVLNARILWAFSAAYRLLDVSEYRHAADHAYTYFIDHFLDYDYGGVYWSLHANGTPLNMRKQTYAIAFAIYGLSEYYRISRNEDALEYAKALYHDIERYASDTQYGGYIEALSRDWNALEDMRLSEKDINAPKSQNTHLHILEAYTALYRVSPDEQLRKRIVNLLNLFQTRLINPDTGHIYLFFENDWTPIEPQRISYGHEIEASWLLDEAALLVDSWRDVMVQRLAEAATEGLQPDGSMIHENTDTHREWWVEAEAVVGYVNIYQRFGISDALEKAKQILAYINTHLIDHKHGEWYWDCDADGRPNLTEPKAGFWKCPYHNSRMCLELLQRECVNL